MAKDPAFLFYPNDYIGGTMGMTLEQKGAYMELLVLQFNAGAFTIEAAKTILSGGFDKIWPALKKKFKEENGHFFNERLEQEKNRRKEFISKQVENGRRGGRKPKQNPDVNPTLNPRTSIGLTNIETETENRNEIKEEGVQGEKPANSEIDHWKQFPVHQDLELNLPAENIRAIIESVRIQKDVDIGPLDVQGLFDSWKINNLTGETYYESPKKIFTHFSNWMLRQNFKKNGYSTAKQNSPHQPVITGRAKTAGSLRNR